MEPICDDCQSRNIEEIVLSGITYYICHNCGDSNIPFGKPIPDEQIPAHMKQLFYKTYAVYRKSKLAGKNITPE